jgi:hypothetical protein
MEEKKKPGFFERLLGQKSSCCSLDIEEIESDDEDHSDAGESVSGCGCSSGCCGSTSKPDKKKGDEV